jgi:hypothetical protein
MRFFAFLESVMNPDDHNSLIINLDDFVKSPTSALCCISQSFNVRKVRLMITKFARLEFEIFTKPSKSDFQITKS